jgi:Flp pilus assembly protein CpaB
MRTGTASPPTGGGFSPSAPFVQPGAPKARRQPALLALGVALIGVSAAGFVFWNAKADHKTSVLVLARDVPYGQRLVAADLKAVQMAVPDGVKAIDAGSENITLNEVATTNLHTGSVLTAADLGVSPPIPAGNSLVAATFDPSILPAGLAPGRSVTLVANGVAQDPNSKSTTPQVLAKDTIGIMVAGGEARQITFKATVVAINDKNKITLAVPQDQATVIEELAFEGRFGLVLLQNSQ